MKALDLQSSSNISKGVTKTKDKSPTDEVLVTIEKMGEDSDDSMPIPVT